MMILSVLCFSILVLDVLLVFKLRLKSETFRFQNKSTFLIQDKFAFINKLNSFVDKKKWEIYYENGIYKVETSSQTCNHLIKIEVSSQYVFIKSDFIFDSLSNLNQAEQKVSEIESILR
ncbi:hypothetical protein [Psychroflexus aestuariivivens]|uniref:hypothetical protein n=1 Tax=Psychroflexus aestuariivivens TaxID=1795040 RepID=UPI000FD6FF9C|nr:hypothetical protein [Psychroflexus aestuariivivens]